MRRRFMGLLMPGLFLLAAARTAPALPGISRTVDFSAAAAAVSNGIQTGLQAFTVPPCRVLDTHDPAGPLGGPALAAGASRDFLIAGRCGIPITARAIVANVTVTGPTGPGHLSMYAAGAGLPLVSAINFRAGQTRATTASSRWGSMAPSPSSTVRAAWTPFTSSWTSPGISLRDCPPSGCNSK